MPQVLRCASQTRLGLTAQCLPQLIVGLPPQVGRLLGASRTTVGLRARPRVTLTLVLGTDLTKGPFNVALSDRDLKVSVRTAEGTNAGPWPAEELRQARSVAARLLSWRYPEGPWAWGWREQGCPSARIERDGTPPQGGEPTLPVFLVGGALAAYRARSFARLKLAGAGAFLSP